MDEKPDITLFFPVYYDERTVRAVAEKAVKVLSDIAARHEVLIIDDCSPDRSGEIADQLAREYPCVRVIHHAENLGYGTAVRAGFANARYDLICFTDGDDEYDVYEFYKLMRLREYYDLIITFRYAKAYSGFRQFLSWGYNTVLRLLFRTGYRDISTGLRMIRRSLLRDLDLESTSPFIGAEIAIKTMLKGYRVGEVGIQTFPRQFGKSSTVTMVNVWATIKDMLRTYRTVFSRDYDMPINRTGKG